MINQEFKYIRGLKKYYQMVEERKELASKSFKNQNFRSLITSHILKTKVNELNSKLLDWIRNKITIKGKIYDTDKNSFIDVKIDLIQPESLFLT